MVAARRARLLLFLDVVLDPPLPPASKAHASYISARILLNIIPLRIGVVAVCTKCGIYALDVLGARSDTTAQIHTRRLASSRL